METTDATPQQADRKIIVLPHFQGDWHDVDPRIREMDDQETEWRCPCVGIPACHNTLFSNVQLLLDHMQEEHALGLIYMR